MKRVTTLPIGTISEGTLRPEDLIPASNESSTLAECKDCVTATLTQIDFAAIRARNGRP